jgi:glycosyltransferase involved in cell wall biosynthesis
LLTFWRELEESDADLIYTRLPHDFLWLAGLFARRSTRTTFVYALANDKQCNPWLPFATRNRYFHNALFALGLRMADVVAIQHEAQAQMVEPYIKGQLVLIPNLVRSVQSEPRRYEETTIDAIWIAHVRPQKQLSILLDIAEQLPALRFVVVGGFGPEPNRSELECRMQGLRNLRFAGPRQFEDVIQLLMSSRVLVNTSCWEGFPNTMLEAWSVGVPVVSLQTDPGGFIGREGLGLVSGTPSQMVRDIMKLVEERPLNCEMGRRGQEYVRRAHGIGAVCRAFEQIVPGLQAQRDAAREGTA